MLDKLRAATPLSWRRKLGPYIGYCVYFLRTRVIGRTWEPRVLSISETLDKLQKEKLSMIRFGDGELSLISGVDLGFQKWSRELAHKLRSILTTDKTGLLICIPGIFGPLEKFTSTGFWFEIHHMFRYAKLWRSLISTDRIYGEAFITRPYLGYKDKNQASHIYRQIKSLWQDKELLIIEGEKSRLGVGNDLFSGARSIKRILAPAENAFSKYEAIIAEVGKYPKNFLILVSLGPAAKVIAYDLFTLGYQVLDIGHLDMEYEMYLRGSEELVAVPQKYFNEIDERNPEDCQDPDYQRQIVARIL